MGERKVLNKYIPPDFDPAAIPRRKMPKNQQIVVRMMLPMSICCKTCGNYIYKGTKFNCRKEDVEGEDYLGIRVFRFYFKCTRCSAELAMKTDPKNSDYIMEAGATRNFEPWRDKDAQVDIAQAKREAEEMGDSMKALENRTLEAKQEMDILAALDEMKSLNSRHAVVTHEDAVAAVVRRGEEEREAEAAKHQKFLELDEEDEAAVKAAFKAQTAALRRLNDEEDEGPAAKRARATADKPSTSLLEPLEAEDADAKLKAPVDPVTAQSFALKARPVKFAVVKKKEPAASAAPTSSSAAAAAASQEPAGLSSLMGAYGSSDSGSSDGE